MKLHTNIPRIIFSFTAPFLVRDILERVKQENPLVNMEEVEQKTQKFLDECVDDGTCWRSGALYEIRIPELTEMIKKTIRE